MTHEQHTAIVSAYAMARALNRKSLIVVDGILLEISPRKSKEALIAFFQTLQKARQQRVLINRGEAS
jgi:hypothetical protein